MIRAVFFGTPGFAVPTLSVLATDGRFDVRLVVSQPDRPAGRGRGFESPAVAIEAKRLGLPLYQPSTLRDPASRRPLAEADADVFLVAAFGLIFGKATLELPRYGCLNLHGSLLPRYRGASPVQAAILSGDDRTGITLMKMDAGLDTGDIVAMGTSDVLPDDTTETLMARLGLLAGDLAARAIPDYCAGALHPRPQPHDGASLTRPLTKADGQIDWTNDAIAIDRRVRALWPWPRAWTTLDGVTIQIHTSTPIPEAGQDSPGTARAVGGRLQVDCGAGQLGLDIVQPAGRGPMTGAAFAAGRGRSSLVFGEGRLPEPLPPLIRPV